MAQAPLSKQSWMAAVALPVAVAACSKPPPETFPVEFLAKSDNGQPIIGASVTRGTTPLGQTGADGSLQVQLTGKAGGAAQVRLACPESFREAKSDFTIPLGRVKALPGAAARVPSYEITCRPKQRSALVVVRTEEAEPMPVLVNGQPSGETSAAGVQHLSYALQPGSKLEVALDTSAYPDLQPQNPSRLFKLGDQDTLFVFEQPFKEKEKPKPRIRRRAVKKEEPKRHVPQRL